MALNNKGRGEKVMQHGALTEEQVFRKLSALCARGEHCQYDMLEKMRQWGIDQEAQARVMQRLTRERYVDDERYTRAFVHDKLAYNQWGRRKIEQALWLKHVDRSMVSSVLDEVDDDQYVSVLRPLLKQKQKNITGRNDYERSMKLMKWAVGRGFTLQVIRRCIDGAGSDGGFDADSDDGFNADTGDIAF